MAEPEELIIDAARHATTLAAQLWRRHHRRVDEAFPLACCKERLELLITATYNRHIPIRIAQPPAPPTTLSRLFGRKWRHLKDQHALPANDGVSIYLPRQLAAEAENPLGIYRVLALQQAGRALRQRPQLPDNALACELFFLNEAVTVDHALALDYPGIVDDLIALRSASLASRPPTAGLTPLELEVEMLFRGLLGAHPAAVPPPFVHTGAPQQSLAWAMAHLQCLAHTKSIYRGMSRCLWLGLPMPTVARRETRLDAEPASQRPPLPSRKARLARTPRVREPQEGEDDQQPGMWMLQMDEPQQHVEDPMGMQRPTDRDDRADPGELADSVSELAEARLVATPRPAHEVLLGDDPLDGRAIQGASSVETSAGIAYPEWDYRIAAYGARGAIVRIQAALLGDTTWAESVLEKRRALLLQVQRRFEGLRPRRVRQPRQADGDEIDIGAYVSSIAERQAGLPLEDRLYESVKAARRDMVITLLIDISASTDAWVSDDLRIVDVEKEALLVVCRALETLGDPYSILAFSGEGPGNVTLWPLKAFDERDNALVQRRIGALEPERYTRTGAALRHATAQLAQREAKHRLLILLSDGKPNDIDLYDGRYGVEDMRQAVAEATLQGVHPFCLTVDRYAPQYLGGVFGPDRYAALRHPERLPEVLVGLLRQLIKT